MSDRPDQQVHALERRLMAKWGWILFISSVFVIGWLANEVYQVKVSHARHEPTYLAACAYADDGDQKVITKVEGLANDLSDVRDLVSWMSGVMEEQTGMRRPDSLMKKSARRPPPN